MWNGSQTNIYTVLEREGGDTPNTQTLGSEDSICSSSGQPGFINVASHSFSKLKKQIAFSAKRGTAWRPASKGVDLQAVLGLVDRVKITPLSSGPLDEELWRLLRKEDQPRFQGFRDRYLTFSYERGSSEASLSSDVQRDWRASERLVQGFFVLSRLHKMETAPEEWDELFKLFLYLALNGILEKFVKYVTSVIFCRWSGDAYPPAPDFLSTSEWCPGYLWPSQFRFHRKTLFLRRRKHCLMAYDFLQVKRCSLPVSRDFVAASLKDHEEALTTVRKSAHETVPWDVLFDSINRTVDEVIPRKTRLNAKVYRPSPSAHTIEMGSELLSRRESGALGFFSKRLPLGQELWSMREVRPGKVVSVYVPVVEDDISSEFAENLDILQDEPNVAVPIALCEPFKVRVITLGSARHYWAARTLQRKIHRLMRRHWTFQLIGRPCRDEDLINQLLGKARPDDYVNSGDYKASTDNLDPDVSDAVMGRICENLGMPYYSWIRDSLTRHVLEYETREALVDCGSLRVRQGPRRRRKQAWGQLMGSPLSFVVLCLANAAASRIPLERYYRKTRLSDLPMLVNGDDIISCGNLPTIERWKQIVTQIGLQPSVGKSYVSKKFCMINSELYELPYRVDWFGCRERKAIFRPYANLGLVFGQGRVQTDSQLLVGDDDARDLSVVSHELIDGQDDLRAEVLLSEFLYAHSTELRNNLPKGMNWFIPKCYGGAGLATLHQFQISKQQAKFAALMRSDPQFRLALRRVLPSTALTPSMEYSARLARELEVPLVEGGETIPRTGLESLIWPLDSSKYDPSEKDFLMGYERLRKKSLRTSLKPMSLDKVMEGNKSEIIGFDVMRCFVTKTNPQVLG